ncbi:bifunctional acetyl-CoA hydrolase/transferase family protein/GNAT family N-acetyltransferase [Desulfosediminicola ganghwensis]|uniref:bifunctional acetyl-CoA hydrolase/transferase family protein/GNAT family N-acetyltransferase n=1 Tax=Desulfosediminicola ganghwensis TaxID=2569540 RepID=UPI0010AC15F5|nr:bifunctional acetyl-CoA hydrolase/transferase family protein/GNAT family N-acetyltransferase [Desulfosediminicola ganghwensis]
MNFDHNWQDSFRAMVKSPKKALRNVRSGQRVFIGTGCAEPTVLVDALVARADDLADVEIIQLFTKGDAPYARDEFSDTFRINSFFIGQNVRSLIQEGMGDYTPMLLSDIPQLFNSGRLPIDVALIQVSPPNQQGMVSLGISVDIVKSAIENASLVIAQVNPRMPCSLGDSQVDVDDLDILVPVDVPILEREVEPVHPISREIGRRVAELIPDGATIEFGFGRLDDYGRVPHATIEFLHHKKDLGVHSEMITDTILELVKSGAVTGSRKSSDRGRIVTSFCLGTRKLYDAIDNNETFSFRPTEYVNDSRIISQQKKMIAINPAREIDLTGQIAADSQQGQLYSGIGGLIDFNRGASRCRDGKSIITLPSTDPQVTRSNIVPHLSEGSGVVVTRGDVHYVVTEYGVAYLHGKSIQERVMALISIAHPDFREKLFQQAIEAHFLRPEFSEIGHAFFIPPDKNLRTTRLLPDGSQIDLRPVEPTDESGMRDLLYNLSEQTVYHRFMSRQANFSLQQIHQFVYVNHRHETTVVASIPEAYGEHLIGVGKYLLPEKGSRAEITLVVRDTWQNKGVGTMLYEYLAELAIANGIIGFTAKVLRENQRMQIIFNHSGHKVTSSFNQGMYDFVIDF